VQAISSKQAIKQRLRRAMSTTLCPSLIFFAEKSRSDHLSPKFDLSTKSTLKGVHWKIAVNRNKSFWFCLSHKMLSVFPLLRVAIEALLS